MIYLFSRKMSEQLGGRPFKNDYEGFVELSREIMKGRTSKQQQETVSGVLRSLMPAEAAERFRKWFPLSKMSAEVNAAITTRFFSWLVGPCEVQPVEVTFQGQKQTWNSGVIIKKCRYLEQSGCVGMCTNMCKVPTQRFFTEDFGLPLTMDPNFEDLSCEMIFGQAPPPIEQDPVYTQPCFTQHCAIADMDRLRACPRTDTDNRSRPAVPQTGTAQ